jgi:hypothetical protein
MAEIGFRACSGRRCHSIYLANSYLMVHGEYMAVAGSIEPERGSVA